MGTWRMSFENTNTESIGRWQDALSLRTDQSGVLDMRVEENEAKLRRQAASLDEQVQQTTHVMESLKLKQIEAERA